MATQGREPSREVGPGGREGDERPRTAYLDLGHHHATLRHGASRLSMRLSLLRVVVFGALVTALVLWDVLSGTSARASAGAAGVLILIFAFLVAWHRRVRRRERYHEGLCALSEEGLLRLDRKWDELPSGHLVGEAPDPEPSGEHPYAGDLHVLGRVSLEALAGPVTSEPGRRTLRSWLLAQSSPTVVALRQSAVKELAPRLDERMELAVQGRLSQSERASHLETLLGWAESEPWIQGQRAIRVAAWLTPPVTLFLVALYVLAGMPPYLIFPALLQLAVLLRLRHPLGSDFASLRRGGAALRPFAPQLHVIENASWSAELLVDVQSRLETGGEPVHRRLDRLQGLVDIVESRRNLVYTIVAPLLLLDVHLGVALDRWRRECGPSVRGWLAALGEVEALAALATLRHDHPTWTFPNWSAEGPTSLRARGLGHPLLPPERCVRNDVEVGPTGTFLLVTGSNMSGKSTLLRAIGTNVVLAGAGGPVCAEELTLPPLRLYTSMRVTESLEEGVSLFMAELLRIRMIVDAAGADESKSPPPVLYLLDEMLQGTNSAERQVAARAVLMHLLEGKTLGAVTTHDLTLHEAPELTRRARPFHFRERVEATAEGTKLHFDYRLRPGLATTRNALRLLEAVGLGSGDPDPTGGGEARA